MTSSGSRGYAARANTRSSRGLWPMTFDPGPDFPWGIVTRRSAYNRRVTEGGELELFEESTSRQEYALQGYLRANNMGRIVAVYSDVASAFDEKAKRPEFENALSDLASGRIGGLAVWRPDRLVRRVSQFRRVLTALEESGGRLLFLKPMLIDTADTENRAFTQLFLDLLVAFAEMESEAIGERVSMMHFDRARKGLVQPSSVRPFGHSEDWFSLVPEEVKVLHEAAKRILGGEASYSIADDFTNREIPKPSGKANWNSNRLRNMLTSPRMVAKREYGGNFYELEGVPPIFDTATWEKVRDALTARTTRSGPVEQHLLSSIALCGLCDRPLASSTSGKKSVKTYVCRPRFEGDDACRKISVSAPHAEARITSLVVAFLADKVRMNALLLKHAAGPDLDAIQNRIAELSESRHALAQALNPPPGVPRMPTETYYEQVRLNEAERDQLLKRMAVNREAALLAEVLNFEDAAHEWETRSLHWKRTILKLVTERIVIEPRGKLLPKDDPRFRPGFNGFDPERVQIAFADEA